jgi:hypothetical protein
VELEGAIDLLAVIMTVLTSVDSISGEIASSTIHAVASEKISVVRCYLRGNQIAGSVLDSKR